MLRAENYMNFPAINILKCVDIQKGVVLRAAATPGIYFVGRQWICSPCDRILSGEDAGILFLSQIVLDLMIRDCESGVVLKTVTVLSPSP